MNKLSLYRQTLLPGLKSLLTLLALALLCPAGSMARAEALYVVVNPEIPLENLNRGDIINIYMGRDRRLTSEYIALPLDIDSDFQEKAEFYKKLIKRDLPEVNSYWTRVMFSGDASPPRQIDNFENIRELIKNNKGAIAYLPKSELQKFNEGEYKVVFVLED